MSTNFTQIDLESWPSGLSHAIAVISIEPDELERRYGLVFKEGVDDLDYFREVVVRTTAGRQLMFLRHREHPYAGTHVHADVGDDVVEAINDLVTAFSLDRNSLSWTKNSE